MSGKDFIKEIVSRNEKTDGLKSKSNLLTKHSKLSLKKGLTDGYTRHTFILKDEFIEKIKDYAYWERLEIKDVINNILEDYFKNKKVKSRKNK